MKKHDTLRTKTGIDGILKHSITRMCVHMAHSGEIEYSNLSVYSVFLKTLAHWKLADVVTIPESLCINDTYVTNRALSGGPDVVGECQEHVLTSIIDLLTDLNSTYNTIFGVIDDFIKKTSEENSRLKDHRINNNQGINQVI